MRRQRKNAFWIALAAPGIIWLVLLFIVPFYAVLAIAMGKLDQLFHSQRIGVHLAVAYFAQTYVEECFMGTLQGLSCR